MISWLRVMLAGVLALALLGLAGCQDEEDPAPSASGSPSSAPEEPTGDSGEATSTPTESTAAPAVPPATGPELLLETSSVHAPEGWKLEDPLAAYQAGASNPTGLGTVSLLDTQGLDVDDTLDDIYRAVRQGLPPGAKPTRQPDIVLGEEQQPAVFFSYTVPDSDLSFSQVVTSRQGRTVSINFSLEPGDLEKDPDLVASVIASFEWV